MMNLKGSFVAIIAPMSSTGELDIPSFRKLLHMHKKAGTKGVVINGTTGESTALTKQEKELLLKVAVEELSGSLLVIAGTGTNNTANTICDTERAFELGVDACLLIAPYYVRPTQKGLFRHFKSIAEAVNKPLILYNHPGRTGVDIMPETAARLSTEECIVAIKEASGCVDRVAELTVKCDSNFVVLSGDDAMTSTFIAAGAKGVISVAANIIPAEMQRLVELSLDKSLDAYELSNSLSGLFDALNLEINPTPIKWAMSELGLIGEGIRLPLLPLSSQYHKELKKALSLCHVINKIEEYI